MDEKHILEDFEKSVGRLEEALNLEKTAITRDSSIKRFELCFDLAWKAIKVNSQKQGLDCRSPRECFKNAFQLGVIGYQEKWLKMIDDRNSAVHLYNEEYADRIYPELKVYLSLFKELIKTLREKIGE